MQNYKNNANSKLIMDKLKYYRDRIDVIDRNIVKLLLSRFKLAEQIADYKKNYKLKLIDKKREHHIINNVKNYSGKKHQTFLKKIFSDIIDYSKKVQSK